MEVSSRTTISSLFDAAANLTLGFGGFFTQALGTLTNNGSFNLGNETFTYDGGSINGNAIEIAGGTLNLNATGAATFRLLGSAAGSRTLNGNVAAGQVIYVEAVDATAASWTWEGGPTVTNSGMIILTNTVPTGTGTTTLQARVGYGDRSCAWRDDRPSGRRWNQDTGG